MWLKIEQKDPVCSGNTHTHTHTQGNEGVNHSVMSDSVPPHGYARLLCPRDFPGKNIGIDLPDPGIEPRSPTLQVGSLLSEPPGKPVIFQWVLA